MEIIEVSDRTPELMEQLLIIWENSVKETHLFLSEAEIADIRKCVPQALAGVPHLIVAKDDANEPVAFMGIDNRRLEMLFVSPQMRGQGVGKKLVLYGIKEYAVNETSVYKGYKRDKIEMRGDRAEMSDFPLYLNTVAGGLDRRDQTIGGFSFVVKIYAVPVVEIIG